MPSILSFESTLVRRLIIISYWLIAVIAACIWWNATSIERLSLPEARVHAQASRTLKVPLSIGIEPRWNFEELNSFKRDLKSRLTSETRGISVNITSLNFNSKQNVLYSISHDDHAATHNIHGRELIASSSSSVQDLASVIAELITTTPKSRREGVVLAHAPQYRLAFSLLNEDAAAGDGIAAWDVEKLLARYIHPVIDRVSVIHNFTIESQIRHHAPLAFTPQPIDGSGDKSHGLTPAELSVFVNSAEWSLSSSVSDDPVIHFLAFVPSVDRRPLRLLDSGGEVTPYNSFILPQWGGIMIVNPEEPHVDEENSSQSDMVFATFQNQLLSLLGVHPLPRGVSNLDKQQVISDWQLDSLMRRRLLETSQSAQDTLSSIVKLVHQIENMPVGSDVRNDVQDALFALDKVFKSSFLPIEQVLRSGINAATLASRAFFNPGMLALLYFPMEHKYAVYTPLFVPIGLPLLASAFKEFKRWRRARNVVE